jgi:hypothetical protein
MAATKSPPQADPNEGLAPAGRRHISLMHRITSFGSNYSFRPDDNSSDGKEYVVVFDPLDRKIWIDERENVTSKLKES